MAGLIPLMLKPTSVSGTRTSMVFPAPPKNTHKRAASDITYSSQPSRPKTMRRQSQPTPASLPVLPYTPEEWRKAIVEIKHQHMTRRYRACSTRCNEILSNVKDTSGAEPAYLIYLNFYAATSLEMCARPLTKSSSYRTSLLQQARVHYDRAAALIQNAETSVVSRSRSSSTASSVSSLHSASSSIFSQAWTAESDMTSPAYSVCSLESAFAKAKPAHKPKKKVSFELPNDAKDTWSSFQVSEPLIRPDSPTLGFDDDYYTAAATRQELPKVPEQPVSRLSLREEDIYSVAVVHMEDPDSANPSDSSDSEDDDPFGIGRSVHRYRETLSSLKMQVAGHLASVEELLSAPVSPLLSGTADKSDEKQAHIVSSEELRRQERNARIERLRKTGWQRKRFDARRYEELCEAVMAELN